MSDSKENKGQAPKKPRWLSKDGVRRLILTFGTFSGRFAPIVIGVALGVWLAEVLKVNLGSGLIMFTVFIICLALFACWVYKKGYDAGRK